MGQFTSPSQVPQPYQILSPSQINPIVSPSPGEKIYPLMVPRPIPGVNAVFPLSRSSARPQAQRKIFPLKMFGWSSIYKIPTPLENL